jgi:DNA topoisomerase I
MVDSKRAHPRETIEQRLQRTGIVRLGSPHRGFRYRRANGTSPTRADRARIASLVIPPAWRDVRIAPSAHERVQAIGRDQRGRLQYRYHEAQTVRRERGKLERILRFAKALPRLRRHVERDLRRRGIVRKRVMAAITRILGSCLLRPGSATYAEANGSFGIATLRPRHVRTRGATIVFEFPGKSGKNHHCEMRDVRVARVVRDLLRVGAKEVFVFASHDPAAAAGAGPGAPRSLVDVRRRHVNAYLAEATGERISAKDFRTWAGTLVCASALSSRGCPTNGSVTHARRAVAAALRETAELLGNTPAVCRKSYVFAPILSAYERGQTVEASVPAIRSLVARDDRRLQRLETAVLRLLRRSSTRFRRGA